MHSLFRKVRDPSKAHAARIMVEEIKKVIEEGTTLRKIILTGINAEQVEEYKKSRGVVEGLVLCLFQFYGVFYRATPNLF